MASSGTINASNRNDIKAQIECIVNSQNVNTNKSNVTVKVKVWRTNSGYTTYGNGTVYCTINGTQYSVAVDSGDKISYGTTYTWFSKTLDIPHNSDGTKKLTIKASITHSQFSIPSTSWTTTLTTIPRSSSFTMNKTSATLGDTVGFTITRANSSFTHLLKIKIGATTYTLAENVGTSSTPTLQVAWANAMPSASKVNATVTCETYNGATKIGSKTASLSVSVPGSMVPSINKVTYSPVNTPISGAYLQNVAGCSVTTEASSSYGAWITNIKVSLSGYNQYATLSNITGGVRGNTTFNLLTQSGSNKMTITVTDSRGRTATTTKTIDVLAYNVPNNTLKVYRCNSDGTSNTMGNSACIRYRVRVSTINGTNPTVTNRIYWQDARSSANDWILIDENNFLNWDEDIVYVIQNELDPNISYNFKIESTDIAKTTITTYNLGTAYSIFHFANQGSSLGIFKSCERTDGIEIGKQTHLYRVMNLYRNDVMTEAKVNFYGCGKTGWDVQVYGGSNTSGTCFGVWDKSNGIPVWRYTTNKRLRLEAEIDARMNFTNGSGGIRYWHTNGSAWGDMIMCSAAGDMIYVGSANHSDGILPSTAIRGANVRLYAHSGGGVFLGASGSTAVTSDRELKHNIEELDDRYLEFFSKLIPVTFIYKAKGNRKHVGFIAQDVEKAMADCGISTMEFAGLIKEVDVDIDMEGNEELQHFNELYSLRYEEFIGINVKVTQHLLNKVSSLESDMNLVKEILGL